MMKTGKRPDGTPIEVMPFGVLGKMTETDLDATWRFLKSLPARPAGAR